MDVEVSTVTAPQLVAQVGVRVYEAFLLHRFRLHPPHGRFVRLAAVMPPEQSPSFRLHAARCRTLDERGHNADIFRGALFEIQHVFHACRVDSDGDDNANLPSVPDAVDQYTDPVHFVKRTASQQFKLLTVFLCPHSKCRALARCLASGPLHATNRKALGD